MEMGKLLVKNTNLYNANSTSSNTLPSATQTAGSDDNVLHSLYVNNTNELNRSTIRYHIDGMNSQLDTDTAIQIGHIYFWMTGCMSVASMFGSVVIIVTYVVFPDLRTSGRKLLVYLSIADFFTAQGNLLGISWYIMKDVISPVNSVNLCKFHAVLTICSSISSFLWTVVIATHLYLCIVKGQKLLARTLLPYFHVVCWLIPGIVGVVAISIDVIGYDDQLGHPSWCWIDPGRSDVLFWQYFTGKAWEIVSYIMTAILYTLIKLFLMKQMKRLKQTWSNGINDRQLGNNTTISSANRNLTFVPIVFIAVRIWGTIRFLIGAHFHDYAQARHSHWIVPLQGLGDSAQGFANFVLFCLFTTRVRHEWSDTLCSTCFGTTHTESCQDPPPERSKVNDNLLIVPEPK